MHCISVDTLSMRGPRRALRENRGVPVLLGLLIALVLGISAAGAEASTYIGRQSAPARGAVMLSVSGRRVTAREVAVDCPKPAGALPGHGSGELDGGRFNVKISYQYFPGGRAGKPVHRWATLTGAIHGASISGDLATGRNGACIGAHYRAAVSSHGTTSAVTNGVVTSTGESDGASEANGGGEAEPTAGVPPFPEEGDYETAFNAAWESDIEGLCHPSSASAGDGAQAAPAGSCLSIVSPENLQLPQD
jgi:hypothetical protein